MTTQPRQEAFQGDLDLFHERFLDFPREVVYRALTDAERLPKWWGPRGFKNRSLSCSPRPGGLWVVTLVGPDGQEYANEYRFTELAEPERVVVEHLTGHWFRLTVELVLAPGGTNVTWRQTFGTREQRDEVAAYCVPGNEENLDKLGEFLAAERG